MSDSASEATPDPKEKAAAPTSSHEKLCELEWDVAA